MRIICLAPDDPFERDYGGSMGIRGLWQSLARRHEVHLIAAVKRSGSLVPTRRVCGVTVQRVVRSRFPASAVIMPYSLASRWNPAFQQAVKEAITALRPHLLFAEHAYMAAPALDLARRYNIPLAVRFHNLEGKYFKELGRASRNFVRKVMYAIDGLRLDQVERYVLQQVRIAFFASLKEMEVARNRGNFQLGWLPPVVQPRAKDWHVRAPGRAVLLTGSLNLPNNVFAVRWFVTSVVPKIRAAVPAVNVVIAGRDPTKELLNLSMVPEVSVVPNPGSMDALYEQCDVVAVPLFHGAGIKVRVLEAISWAKPVVGTDVAFDGSGLRHGDHVLTANNAEDFAAAILNALMNPRDLRPMVLRALAYLEETFGEEAIQRRFEQALAAAGLRVKHAGCHVTSSRDAGSGLRG